MECSHEHTHEGAATTLSVLGEKWTIQLLHHIVQGNNRFGQLQRAMTGISPKTLTVRLRALEEAGILTRKVFPGFPLHVEYAATERGEALGKVIRAMDDWRKGLKSTRRSGKLHSDGAESTNESRQSIREGLLLVRLEFCQQALMSFRQTPGQTRGSLVPCITQMQSEYPRIVKIAHPLHPSPPLQVLDEATHRTFLEVQLLCQHLLRHRCLGGERHQRKHLGEREGEAGRHLVGPVQSERLEKLAK